MSRQLFLANPNFSAGADLRLVDEIAEVVRNRPGVTLVKVDAQAEFNRTVLTLVGEWEPLETALVDLTAKCAAAIDMREHRGTHPRMGSMDVVPMFPFKNTTIEDCVKFAKGLGEKIFDKTGLPVYYAEGAAGSEPRKKLPFIRKGQFEGLRDLLKAAKDDPARAAEYESRKPDLSADGLLSETAGGVVLEPMNEIAAFFNIFLDTEDLGVAKSIAESVRAIGGGFATVTAIGIKFEERPGTVVSMNVLDCAKTPIYRPFEFVKAEAARYGARVTGSELVGIVRLDFLINCFEHQLQLEGFKKEHIIETHLM